MIVYIYFILYFLILFEVLRISWFCDLMVFIIFRKISSIISSLLLLSYPLFSATLNICIMDLIIICYMSISPILKCSCLFIFPLKPFFFLIYVLVNQLSLQLCLIWLLNPSIISYFWLFFSSRIYIWCFFNSFKFYAKISNLVFYFLNTVNVVFKKSVYDDFLLIFFCCLFCFCSYYLVSLPSSALLFLYQIFYLQSCLQI